MEDLPADLTPEEVVAAMAEPPAEPGDLEGLPGAAVEADAPDLPVGTDEPDPAAEVAPAPRRRRRATSRPAGPPVASTP
jgi:hypothetical protein